MKTTRFRRVAGILSTLLKLALLLLLVTGLADAQKRRQEAPASPDEKAAPARDTSGDIIKVVHVKYANVFAVSHLLDFFHVQMKADSSLKVITIGGPPAKVAAVEEAIKQLDVPPPPTQNIHITVYLLMATRRPPGDTNFRPGDVTLPPGQSGAQLPEDLREVVKQLQGVMDYHSFRLVHTLTLLTTVGGSARIEGMTPIATRNNAAGVPPSVVMANVHFSINRAETLGQEKLDSVNLQGMSLAIYLPSDSTKFLLGGNSPVADFSTNVEVGGKQRVVVGKTDIFNPDLALFLVISAKVTN
jgi:Bacterial type II/III secretion system short domain